MKHLKKKTPLFIKSTLLLGMNVNTFTLPFNINVIYQTDIYKTVD